MKKKKVISAIVLFGLALSSCKGCPSPDHEHDPIKRDASVSPKDTEKDKFYSDAEVACDASKEALGKAREIATGGNHNTLDEARAWKDSAEALDKLALILDRGESKNWEFRAIIIDDYYGIISPEGCRTLARRARAKAESIRVAIQRRDRERTDLLARFVVQPTRQQPRRVNCGICFDDSCENPAQCPACNNQFCYNCIAGWLNSAGDSCPVCRAR
ncbi:hypothetical protein AGMMS50222_10190 [Endomicrobiia bacterium]|nr:hypothetical protein AGMMS49556_09390 [Endomicrobiia bacterium]GHT76940.1 hypothetical protein AGMMS50222_10190 [Endomicrobiia bacterium]